MKGVLIPDLVEPTEESRKKAFRECKNLLEVIPIIEELF